MTKLLKAATGGYLALVDDEDYERCLQFSWYRLPTGHFNSPREPGLLHQFIMGPTPKGLEIVHVNQNPQNNTKENLRFVTHAQNCSNTRRHLNENHSIFKQAGKFRVHLTRNTVQYHVGYFNTIEEARAGRDTFVNTNFGNLVGTR